MRRGLSIQRSNKLERKTRAIYHLARPTMVRTPCLICGNDKVVGHHSDYSRPLDVVYLCRKHHILLHCALQDFETALLKFFQKV